MTLDGSISTQAVIAASLLALGAFAARADVIYVDDSATAGANTGQSWPDAFTDLQSALAIAQAGDEIRVAQGTYKPAPPGGDRTISFNLVSGTILQGGYAGFGASDPDANDPELFVTTFSGDLNGDDAAFPSMLGLDDNALHVLTGDALSAVSVLRGFTVTAGFANDLEVPGDSQAAGLRMTNGASPQVDHCVFMHNRAFSATAIDANTGGPILTRCRFTENLSLSFGNSGGGAIVASGPALIRDCMFQANSGGTIAGAIHMHPLYGVAQNCIFIENHAESGGAIRGGLLVLDCFFIRNSGGSDGGGAAEAVDTVVNCVFLDNFGDRGGALLRVGHVINCIFMGNRSNQAGSAIHCTTNTSIFNCTLIAKRVTPIGGGAIGVYQGARVSVRNSILWANASEGEVNEDSQIDVWSGAVLVQNTCVQGWTGSLGGVGNHGNDPRFIDAEGPDDIYGTPDDDPRLRPNSPCIDSGDATLLPPDEFDLDDDGDVTEPLPIDLDGLPRVVGASLDMGAFEFQGIPCLADINGDSSVGIDDLLAVISGWGPCVPGEMCNADLDLDSAVTLLDLQRILDDWGACR